MTPGVSRHRPQLVSTSVSSIEPDIPETQDKIIGDNDNIVIEEQVIFESSMSTNSEVDTTATMDAVARDLRGKQQDVKDAMEDLTEDDIDAARVATVERDIDRILDKRDG